MEEPKILHNMNYDFDIWYKTYDPVFSEISKQSRLPEKWISFDKILSGKNKDSILKPINKYVEELYPAPQLVSIEGKKVRLRQGNHAEMFLLIQDDGSFYNLDRPWMRQYYQTKNQLPNKENCFDGTYIFYAPWYIDENILVRYERPSVETAFLSYPTESLHKKTNESTKYLEPDFIQFQFKKIGKHIDRDGFGKIARQNAMFDIVFECDDIMLKRVKDFYEKRSN